MTLPLAALGALLAALLETSVAPELAIGGAQADLVLALAIAAAMVMGLEDGLVWAFLGGLMLDMLVPGRPIGATTVVLLLAVGVAALAVRIPAPRRALAVAAVFALTFAFHLALTGVLSATTGLSLSSLDVGVVLVSAVINAIVALPAVIAFTAIERRFGVAERADW
ncbi:MAG TPA: hypothetical protein VH741_00890 [Candidatus Limnocylindrales bacterium]